MSTATERNPNEQLKNILAGWRNVLIQDPQIEALAQTRGEICLRCPHRKRIVCGKCGCPLKAKLRAPDATCPDDRWHA